jgi:hypothetical protein
VLVSIRGRKRDTRDGTQHKQADVPAVIVVASTARIGTAAAAMVIAADIGKHALATLIDPQPLPARIKAPRAVENAGRAGNLVNQLRRSQWRATFAVLISNGMTLDSHSPALREC